jgi:cob(I)alamin adenosyltransferase
MSKLYTKKGDKGQTSLYDGSKHSKTEPIFSTLGDIDELNSAIGLLIAFWGNVSSIYINKSFLRKIQYHLINISSVIATPGKKKNKLTRITEEDISELEKHIDYCQSKCPPLKQFILPGPQLPSRLTISEEQIQSQYHACVSAQAHVCRAITRRVERRILNLWENLVRMENVPLTEDEQKRIDEDDSRTGNKTIFCDNYKAVPVCDCERNTLIYLNRLSDFFFAYSRVMVNPQAYHRLEEITMEEMRAK